MKRYKISESKLNEFWGWFGKKKPQTMQQVIDNDPILKQLDKELEDIATSYIPRFKQMKKEDPKLFKRMQDMGIIGKSW
jgi:hypothetical protein